jgi:hypothetical protein
MTDIMFFIYTKVLGIDLKDAHDIPWGTNLFLFPIIGLIIGMIVLHFIGNVEEDTEDKKDH